MPIVEPVEVCSETTGPAHGGDLGWPQAASKRKPGDEDQSDAKAIAYRLPSPTSVVTHEMPSPFCLVPGSVEVCGPPPSILHSPIKIVDLTTRTTKRRAKACDEVDEISPCTAADGVQASSVYERNPSSTGDSPHLAQQLACDGSAALEIQEEEDAALARRLAGEGEWVSF